MSNLGSFYVRWTPRALSVLRIIVGFLLMQHGAQKLFGFLPVPGMPPATAFSLFNTWNRAPDGIREAVLHEILPEALAGWGPSAREDLGELFYHGGSRAQRFWIWWDEEHPPAGALGRVFKRRRQARSG